MTIRSRVATSWSGIRRTVLLGSLLGVIYGLAARYVAETEAAAFFALISIAFLMIVPTAMGYLAVYPAVKPRWWYMLFVPWIPVSAGVVVSVLTAWEGAICVVMSLPLLLILSSMGGRS